MLKGPDYYTSMRKIARLRRCSMEVTERVTFHLFFEHWEAPKRLLSKEMLDEIPLPHVNCSLDRHTHASGLPSYRAAKNLTYPINVARNVARENAETHFVLASDVELVPSAFAVEWFLDMIRRDDEPLVHQGSGYPSVYVLPVFEVHLSSKSDFYEYSDNEFNKGKCLCIVLLYQIRRYYDPPLTKSVLIPLLFR
jgi:hypothetical protein